MRHAIGQSYREIAEAQRGIVRDPPVAVVTARSREHVAAALALCGSLGLAVVPFGGGTSVTGGVRGPGAPHVALSLRGMRRVVDVDIDSLTATVEAGVLGPELHDALLPNGVALPHYPQSFERSTVGGWVATRSAGQYSTGYGAIADMVIGLRAVTPKGEIIVPARTPSAEGPDVEQLLIGSEGRYGVITDVTLRLSALTRAHDGGGWLMRSFGDGLRTVRILLQNGPVPHLVRLSDERETSLLTGGSGALLLLAAQGADGLATTLAAFGNVVGESGKSLGSDPYWAWHRSRFDAPYLRDALVERGMIADSLETSALWSDIDTVYRAVRDALTRALDPQGRALVLCHLSHAYSTGASLYFTFVAPGGEDSVERWWAAKHAALDAMIANGATVSHHHGIGRDHREWQARRVGETGMRALDSVAQALDPDRVLAANRV